MASTLERAYALARSGACRDLSRLKDRLKADGYRAVDSLLAARSVREHLAAICAATFKPELADAGEAVSLSSESVA